MKRVNILLIMVLISLGLINCAGLSKYIVMDASFAKADPAVKKAFEDNSEFTIVILDDGFTRVKSKKSKKKDDIEFPIGLEPVFESIRAEYAKKLPGKRVRIYNQAKKKRLISRTRFRDYSSIPGDILILVRFTGEVSTGSFGRMDYMTADINHTIYDKATKKWIGKTKTFSLTKFKGRAVWNNRFKLKLFKSLPKYKYKKSELKRLISEVSKKTELLLSKLLS